MDRPAISTSLWKEEYTYIYLYTLHVRMTRVFQRRRRVKLGEEDRLSFELQSQFFSSLIPGVPELVLPFLNFRILPLILTIHTCFGYQNIGNLTGSQVISLKL